MKNIILIFALLITPLLADRNLRFYWDEYTHTEIDGFKLYIKSGEEWEETTTTNSTTLEYRSQFPDQQFTVGLTAFIILENGQIWESPKSTLTVPGNLMAPPGVKVEIKISIKTSKTLDNFEDIATITLPIEKYQQGFFKLEQQP